MRAVIALALAVGLSGCASVIVRPDDGIGTKTVKVATRAVLAVGTIGFSEIRISNTERAERLDENWRRFYAELGEAKTKVKLIGLMGLPETCEPIGEGLETCEWRGFIPAMLHSGTLAGSLVHVDSGGNWFVNCLLPLDGSEREPDSCRVRY